MGGSVREWSELSGEGVACFFQSSTSGSHIETAFRNVYGSLCAVDAILTDQDHLEFFHQDNGPPNVPEGIGTNQAFLPAFGYRRRSELTATFVARLTIAICLLSAIAEASLGCTSTSKLSMMDAPIVLFMMGPYLFLAILAWLQRGERAASWILMALIIGLSVWGLYFIAEDSYRYHTDANYRKLQRLVAFFVPLVQYAVVVLVGMVTMVRHLVSSEK